jgi:hypothetical protein
MDSKTLIINVLHAKDIKQIEQLLLDNITLLDDQITTRRVRHILETAVIRKRFTKQEIIDLCNKIKPDLVNSLNLDQIIRLKQEKQPTEKLNKEDAKAAHEHILDDPGQIKMVISIFDAFANGKTKNVKYVFRLIKHFKKHTQIRAKFQQAMLTAVKNGIISVDQIEQLLKQHAPDFDMNEDLTEYK